MVLMVVAAVLSYSGVVLTAEFSGVLVEDKFDGRIESKIYVKGDKICMKTDEGAMIIDPAKGNAIVLNVEEKMYYEMPDTAMLAKMGQSTAEADKELAKIADKKLIGTEKVNGYICDKYEIIYHDESSGKMTQWFSKELNYPIKTVYKSSFGEMRIELKDIKKGEVNDSLFEVPAGYEKMSMTGMGRFENK